MNFYVVPNNTGRKIQDVKAKILFLVFETFCQVFFQTQYLLVKGKAEKRLTFGNKKRPFL